MTVYLEQFKKIQCSNLGMCKGYNLSINSKIIYKRGTFIVQNNIEHGKGLDFGAQPSRIKLC